MRVIVVNVADLLKTPPALSVIKSLDDLGYQVVVCTMGKSTSNYEANLGELNDVIFEYICETYDDNISLANKLIRMFQIRKKLWSIIDKYYDEDTIIWVISDNSLKHLGSKITEKRYIIHFLELVEDLYYISGNPILKMNRKAYTEHAKAIIECEYNRAHITKAWWELKNLPFVLPNKPYVTIDIPNKSKITTSNELSELISKLEGKKIVLYQGNISKERPLDMYIKAVDELGSDWAFVMMLNGENPYPELKTKNTYFVPFVAPPFHMEVTSHAYIGILSYVPVKNSHSILNTLYCAPNKIWEYSKFGVPMISNDLPALKYEFTINKMGICVRNADVLSIKKALLEIDKDYKNFSDSAKRFYEAFDYEKQIYNIIKYASN